MSTPTPLISIAEARELVLRETWQLVAERVDVDDALDRVLAEDLTAAADVPPFACSAMDGFAVRAGPAARTLRVIGESRAGAPSHDHVHDKEAIRISTGAAIPAGATAVIRQEDVTVSGADGAATEIETHAAVRDGANIRGAGEDMRAETTVLRAGTTLRAAELGAAVAAGAGRLPVTTRPRTSIFCTGDELRAPGDPLGPGEIHNSNAPMITALATHSGARPYPVQRLRDHRAATEEALGRALERSDIVIVTGGVSVGPHDHVRPALAALGVTEQFWGVALQPGKPTWFGTRGATLVFGLPGNPVSAVVTFALFAYPAIVHLLGTRPEHPLHPDAALGEPIARNPAREQAVRVRLERRDADVVAIPNGPQGSHILSSLVGADALALIPRGEGHLAAGERVHLHPLPR
jgi:molybdopterin molybdotransferase